MKTANQKIDQAKNLLEILVKKTDGNNIPCARYYKVLKIYQKIRNEYNNDIRSRERTENTASRCYFEKPELRVTSTTYENAKRRINRQIDLKFGIK